MLSTATHFSAKGIANLLAIVAVVFSFSLGHSALAAPHTVGYKSTKVTTVVPGKSVTLNLRVKNTGTTTYAGVKVIFHIPDQLELLKVSPANAVIEDGIVSWSNVPIAGGKSFYPSLTLKMASGTPLKTKVSIWTEVTGQDMEATSTNFSLTAVKAPAKK